MKGKWIAKGILMGILCIGAFFALGYIVMYLWNWLMPAIFGFKTVTYCQAFGLFILAKLLFGGFKGRWHGRCGGHCHGGRSAWKSRWEEKWTQMTPEERERVKKGLGKCGWNYGDEKPEKSE
jgi:hypothetical protein